jgi:hypothetical protein
VQFPRSEALKNTKKKNTFETQKRERKAQKQKDISLTHVRPQTAEAEKNE